MNAALAEIRTARRAITGFARFLLAGEEEPAKAHCLHAILQATETIEAQVARLSQEDGPARGPPD